MESDKSDTTEAPAQPSKKKFSARQKFPVENHARDRLLERHGLVLSWTQWRSVVDDIKAKRALLVSRLPNGSEVWAVTIQDIPVRLTFKPTKGMITTVLGPEMTRLRRNGGSYADGR